MRIRLQKALATVGVESRRHVEDLVRAGRVEVNGRTVTTLPVIIDVAADRVAVDGEPVDLSPLADPRGSRPADEHLVYVVLNKPPKVVTTNVGQTTNAGEQTRAVDLLPAAFTARYRVFPVGRLDAETRGLLILTNDGELTQKLTHPRYGVPKVYRATVDGRVTPDTVRRLEEGVWLSDPRTNVGFKASSRHVKIVKTVRGGRSDAAGGKSVLELTLTEGRNRQVRRMLAGLGHKVRELVRVRFGPIALGELKPGRSRPLTDREVKALRQAASTGKTATGRLPKSPRPSPEAAPRPALKSGGRDRVVKASAPAKRPPVPRAPSPKPATRKAPPPSPAHPLERRGGGRYAPADASD